MYIKRKLKNTYINFQICEFLQPQNKGVKTAVKISVSTARIESRATDISLGRISGALAGASHWNKNIQIEKAAKRDGLGNAATALRAQYGFGDGMQRAQLESILKGGYRTCKRERHGRSRDCNEGRKAYRILG